MKVETYNSSVLPDATPRQSGPIEMGLGQGQAALAQGLEQLGHASTRLAIRKQEEDDHLWSMNAVSAFRQQHLKQFEEAKNAAPDGADGFTEQQNNYFEGNLKTMLDTAPTKRARQLAEVQAREFQQSYFAHSLQFESAERQRNRFQLQVDGAKLESNEIDMAANPLDSYMQVVPARLKLIAGSGEDPATRQKIADAVSNHFSKTLVLADARRDPAGTLAKIDDGTYSKLPGWNLYGDQLDMLRRGVEARANHKDVGESAAIRDAINEHIERVKRAEFDPNTGRMTPVPEFPFSDERVEKALGPVAYKNWKEKQRVLPIVMEIGAKIPLASDTEIQSYRRKLKTDIDSGKISAELGNAAESTLDDIIKHTMKERREDPALAAQRTAAGIFGESYTNATHADQLNARVMVQKSVFGLKDHEVRLLGKEELKSTVRKLQDMQPDEVQAYLRDLPTQINESLKAATFKQVAHEMFNPEKMSSLYMAELFQHGGLNKEYMWVNFSSSQHYGNTLLKAISAKDAELAKSMPKEQVVDLHKQVETNETLNQFTRIIAASGGTSFIGSLQSLVTKAAMISMNDPSKPQVKNVIDAIVHDIVDDQISLNGTYYVPKSDPLTHRPLDHKAIDVQLKTMGDTWTKSDGTRFQPVINTRKESLQGSQTHIDGSLNPRDGTYVWLSNSDGSGVYRAVRMMGSAQADQPGVYTPVLDSKGQRYELLFKDLSAAVGYAKANESAPKRISSGTIRGR